MKWFSQASLAVDIGSRTVKGLVLKKTKGKVVVESYFFHDLLNQNEMFPIVDDLQQKFSGLVEVNKLTGHNAIASLQDLDMLSHEIVLPDMPKKDLDMAISNFVEEHFNLPVSDACIDYVKLEAKDKSGVVSNLYKIYCAKKNRIDTLALTLSQSGLKPKVIDSGVLAQVAMLKHNEFIEDNKSYALLEIGESHSTISLIVSNRVHLTNVLTIGLGAINRGLYESLGLPYERAELLKLTFDLNERDSEMDETQMHFDDVLNEIFYRIQRMIGYFKVHLKQAKIEALLLTGGGSQIKNIDKALETTCGLPTIVVNPFKNIEIYSGKKGESENRLAEIAPHMATAVGLALREIK